MRMLDISPSHLMQRRDALESAFLQTAHHFYLPGGTRSVASNPRFDDSEVPIAVVGVYAPGSDDGATGIVVRTPRPAHLVCTAAASCRTSVGTTGSARSARRTPADRRSARDAGPARRSSAWPACVVRGCMASSSAIASAVHCPVGRSRRASSATRSDNVELTGRYVASRYSVAMRCVCGGLIWRSTFPGIGPRDGIR